MAFTSPLDLKVSLQLTADGPWTDISTYAYQRDGTSPPVTITRGRPDESSSANPAACQMQWNNRDGRFTPGNPTGPYYGQIGRNTPVRVSVPDSGTYLRLEDDDASYAASADKSAFHITGDIDLRLDMNLSDWQQSVLAAKWASGQQCWQVVLNADGTITFYWSTTGSDLPNVVSTAPLPLGRGVLRITLAVASGTVTFWTAAGGNASGGPFTQLGAAVVAGATSIFAGTAAIAVGNIGPGFTPLGAHGQFFEFQMRNGILGTVEADIAFSSQTAGATSFTDFQGNTWTVSGTAEISGRSYRFHGECASLPVAWDPSGNDVWVPVAAGGLLRRLQQGSVPVLSPMRRAVAEQASVEAYWPMEDLAQSNQLATGLASGGLPMYVNQGTPTFASDSTFACSNSLPVLNGSYLSAVVGSYTAGSSLCFRFLLDVPAGGESVPTGTALFSAYLTGTAGSAVLFYNSSGVGLGLNVGNTGAGGTIAVDGIPGMVSVEMTTSGSNISFSLTFLPVGSSSPTTFTATATAQTIGTVRSVRLGNPAIIKSGAGHLYAQTGFPAVTTLASPLDAWAGETAGNRFARLCGENGVQSRIYGYPNATVVMGQQPIDTLENILQECEDADHGVQYEPRQCLGLGYRTLKSVINQTPLTLSYTAAETGDGQAGIGVTYDDQYTVNDWLITRNNGSSYEATLNDGSQMSISNPPAGAGDYQSTKTLYVNTDSQLPDAATWMLHVSTVNEPRYPVIPLSLVRSELSGLYYNIQNAELGDYLAISSAPAWLPPGNVKQVIAGTSEALGGGFWRLAWQCVPESPYEVLQYDTAGFNRWDTDGSVIAAAATSSATSLTVATLNPGSPSWTTSGGDFPFNIQPAGELVTVTNITNPSGSASAPAANTQLVLVALSPATYAVFWSVTLSGTLSGSDVNNFALYNGTTFVTGSTNPATAGTYVQVPQLITVGAGTPSVKILSNSTNATAGSTYTATFLSPQTFTVTRSVNGVSKAQTAGTAVHVYPPPVWALT